MALRVFLVTGGCGFIGRYIVEELISCGYKVRVVDNLSAPGSSCVKHTNVEFVQMDLRDRSLVSTVFKGIDICVALAARCGGIGFFNQHPADMLNDNTRIISATFDAARIQGIRRMVYVSSSCVFDYSSTHIAKEAILESCPPPPAGYPFSKLIGEHYCKAYFQQYGLPYTIVRPFNAYGIGEMPSKNPGDTHVIPDLTAKLLIGQSPLEIFGDGQQTRCFTHVKDIARGIVLTLESPQADNEDFNGRRLQLGGGRSNENPVRFWNFSPEVPKEADARCYALWTAYATMIRLCNISSACWKTPAPSRH